METCRSQICIPTPILAAFSNISGRPKVMEDFGISVAGKLKLLRNLKPGKPAGLDKLKPILLKELSEEIAPIIQAIFELSI